MAKTTGRHTHICNIPWLFRWDAGDCKCKGGVAELSTIWQQRDLALNVDATGLCLPVCCKPACQLAKVVSQLNWKPWPGSSAYSANSRVTVIENGILARELPLYQGCAENKPYLRLQLFSTLLHEIKLAQKPEEPTVVFTTCKYLSTWLSCMRKAFGWVGTTSEVYQKLEINLLTETITFPWKMSSFT